VFEADQLVDLLEGPAGVGPKMEKFLATIYPAAITDVNVWGDRLMPLVEPRLLGDAFYLFADPAESETMTVASLSGNEGPQVEIQPGWRIDGVEWKVREDFGAAWADYRGAYMVPVAEGE
jgi:hypothetical protein